MPLYAKIYVTIMAVHCLCGFVCMIGLGLFDISILERPFKYCWTVFSFMGIGVIAAAIYLAIWT
jgi:hypothetical protein